MIWFALLLACPAAEAAGKEMWHEWYLVSRDGAAVSLYEETAETRPKDGQIAITQKWIEKLGARTETYVGSVAGAESLRPVAFFVERKGGPMPFKTDARARGKKLEITFKPSSPDLAKSTELADLPPQAYLSSFVPLAVARRLRQKGSFSFTAIVEDAGEMKVEIKKAEARPTTDEKTFGKERCRKAGIQFDGQRQEWWITPAGKVCLVEFPGSGTRLELSTEKKARKALGEGE